MAWLKACMCTWLTAASLGSKGVAGHCWPVPLQNHKVHISVRLAHVFICDKAKGTVGHCGFEPCDAQFLDNTHTHQAECRHCYTLTIHGGSCRPARQAVLRRGDAKLHICFMHPELCEARVPGPTALPPTPCSETKAHRSSAVAAGMRCLAVYAIISPASPPLPVRTM